MNLLTGKRGALPKIMVLLVGLAIAASSLMPGSTKQDLLIFELGDFYLLFATEIGGIEGIKWGNPEFFQFNASEVAHFILFFFLGLGVFLAQQNFSRGMQFFSLLIFGAVIEFLQHFIVGRVPSVGDWAFDVGGVVFAFIITFIMHQVFEQNSGDNPPSEDFLTHL